MNRGLADRLARLEQAAGVQLLPADRQAAVDRAELIFKAAAAAHAAVRGARCCGRYTMPLRSVAYFPDEADRLLVELRALTLEVGPAWQLRRERLFREVLAPPTLNLDGQAREPMRESIAETVKQLREADDER